jgi:hypothetical protein
MIPAMRTEQQHEMAGRNAVLEGRLGPLRAELGLTRSGMAEILLMSPVTYNRCEDDPTSAGRMWQTTATRLGRFLYLAERTVLRLRMDGVDITKLVHLPAVATMYGLPQEVLLSWYRSGEIAAEDLGILGLWIHKSDLYLVEEAV